jgi:hypothetical protein
MIQTKAFVSDDSLTINRVQDVQPILEYAAEMRATGSIGSDEMRHVARIPTICVEQYMQANGVTWSEFINNPEHAERMLNDPALAGFRIWQGRV